LEACPWQRLPSSDSRRSKKPEATQEVVDTRGFQSLSILRRLQTHPARKLAISVLKMITLSLTPPDLANLMSVALAGAKLKKIPNIRMIYSADYRIKRAQSKVEPKQREWTMIVMKETISLRIRYSRSHKQKTYSASVQNLSSRPILA
jgi:hypothetical protein